MASEYKPEFNRLIASQTHCLDGHIRIMEIEFVDAKTGKSRVFRGLAMLRNREAWSKAALISKRPNLFQPTMTDGGLRMEVNGQLDGRDGTFWVYSY